MRQGTEKTLAIQSIQTQLLYQNAPTALSANIVNGVLLLILVWDAFPPLQLIAWFAILCLVTLGRGLLVMAFQSQSNDTDQLQFWTSGYVAGALIAGIVWGVCGFMLLTSDVLEHIAFAAFLLSGMAAGAIATSAPWRSAYLAFMLPILVPVAALFFLKGDRFYMVMGLLTVVFTILLLRTSAHLNTSLRRHLSLAVEHGSLIESLSTAKNALEHTNLDLADEVKEHREARRRLQESEGRFRTLAETTSAAIFVYRNGFAYMNPAGEAICGYTAGDLLRMSLEDIAHPDFRALIRQETRRLLREKTGPTRHEIKVNRHGSAERWVDITIGVINYDGKPAILGTAIDISDYKRIQEVLAREKELAQVPLESIGDGVVTTDVDGLIEYMNPVAEQLTGWTQAEARGHGALEILSLVDESTGAPIPNPVERCLAKGDRIRLSGPTWLVRREGDRKCSVQLTTAPIRDPGGETIGVAVVFHDVTTLHRLSQRMSYQASHDSLTGLTNRQTFEDLLQSAITSANEEDAKHVLCYMDLDQFKVVNDTCGHAAGDDLLIQVATVLRSRVRENDVLARLGGDEFGLLLRYCSLEKAVRVAESIREALQAQRFVWHRKLFDIGVSIGIVPIAQGGTLADLLSAADSACYVAKDLGRNRIHVYKPTDEVVVQHKGHTEWVQRIRYALDHERFHLLYQRIESLSTDSQEVDYFELLLRMSDESGRMIVPGAFLPAAERYHLMPLLDRWVIGTAISKIAPYLRQREGAVCAINLSGQSLGDESLLAYILEELERNKLAPEKVCFEFPETAAVSRFESTLWFVESLKSAGCRLALDDFGSGLSSFSYLKRMPVDYLKIDGSVIKDIAQDPIDQALLESINRIGHVMGKRTIAEFVETQETRETLRDLGVDFAQGFGIHKPQSIAALTAGLDQQAAS